MPRPLEERKLLIAQLRKNALQQIISAKRVDGLRLLSSRAKNPYSVGVSTAESTTESELDKDILDELSSDEPFRLAFAAGFISERLRQEGEEWVKCVLEGDAISWDATRTANFCLALPCRRAIWEIVSNRGPEVERLYWRNARPFFSKEEPVEEIEYAIEKLLGVGRAFAALDVAGAEARKVSSALLTRVLKSVPPRLNAGESATSGMSLDYEVEEVLRALDQRDDVDEIELARVEWLYLPLY